MNPKVNNYFANKTANEIEFFLFFWKMLEKIGNDPISIEIPLQKVRVECEKKAVFFSESMMISFSNFFSSIFYDKDGKVLTILPQDYDEIIVFFHSNNDEMVQLLEKKKSEEQNSSDGNDGKDLHFSLVKELKTLYIEAPENYKMTVIHLFGIKYGDQIRNNSISIGKLAADATGQKYLFVELGKGVRLSEFIKINSETNLLNTITRKIGFRVGAPEEHATKETDTPKTRTNSRTTWKQEIARIISDIPSNNFTLSDVYVYKDQLKRIFPYNTTVESSIRSTLQELRDLGYITFVRDGEYRKNHDR